MALSPTLWRTCRVLAGGTRLALLRRVIKHPGLSVSELVAAEKIDLARASQELRRLQARGIVDVEREGRRVRYFPEPDPLETYFRKCIHGKKIEISFLAQGDDLSGGTDAFDDAGLVTGSSLQVQLVSNVGRAEGCS